MDDLLIDACQWHLDAEASKWKKRALEHFRDRYVVLLEWMRAEGLLSDPSLGLDVTDWKRFEFRRSDLTDEGWEVVRRCHGKWNPAFGQGRTQRHLIQWKKRLRELRKTS